MNRLTRYLPSLAVIIFSILVFLLPFRWFIFPMSDTMKKLSRHTSGQLFVILFLFFSLYPSRWLFFLLFTDSRRIPNAASKNPIGWVLNGSDSPVWGRPPELDGLVPSSFGVSVPHLVCEVFSDQSCSLSWHGQLLLFRFLDEWYIVQSLTDNQ